MSDAFILVQISRPIILFTSVLVPSDPKEGFSSLLTLMFEFLLLSKGSFLIDLVVSEYASISNILKKRTTL